MIRFLTCLICSAGLNGKILLRVGNLRLARVAVLGDKVTCKTRKMVINHFLNSPLTANYRFARARKVMFRVIARLLARGRRLINRVLKAAPLGVTQQRLQVSRAPVFSAVLIELFQLLKRLWSNGRVVFVFHIFPIINARRRRPRRLLREFRRLSGGGM